MAILRLSAERQPLPCVAESAPRAGRQPTLHRLLGEAAVLGGARLPGVPGKVWRSDSAPAWGIEATGQAWLGIALACSHRSAPGNQLKGREPGSESQNQAAGPRGCRRGPGTGGDGAGPTCSLTRERRRRRQFGSNETSPLAAANRKPPAPKPGQGAPGSSRDTLAQGSRADPNVPTTPGDQSVWRAPLDTHQPRLPTACDPQPNPLGTPAYTPLRDLGHRGASPPLLL